MKKETQTLLLKNAFSFLGAFQKVSSLISIFKQKGNKNCEINLAKSD